MTMTPETVVRLLSNVPFSLSQNHVRDFQTLQEQTDFFLSKTSQTFTQFTYQREERAVKVPVNIDKLYSINYIMYQNSEYSTKWFYGFVTRKEYINPNTTALYFEIDVYQTWLFDIELKPSYVIREHCNRWRSDGSPEIFTLDEGLNYGDSYETVSVQHYTPFDNVFFLVVVCKSAMHVGAENQIKPTINGYPQPLNYYVHPFRLDGTLPSVSVGGSGATLSKPLDLLESLFTQETAVNNVVSVYITEYFDNIAFTGGNMSFSGEDFETVTVSDNQNLNATTIHVKNLQTYRSKLASFGNKYDGFHPVEESKLLMYPYTVIVLDDMKGNRIELKPEYINSDVLQLRVKGSLGAFNKTSYQPENYLVSDSVTGNQVIGQEYALINKNPNDIPILAEMLSAYFQGNRNTIENTRASLQFNAISSAVTGAVGGGIGGGRLGMLGAIGGLGIGAVNSYYQIESLNAKERDIANTPPQLSNMGGNTSFDYGNDISGVYVIKKQITQDHRQRLENYFKMYGYKINRLKRPNTRTRKYYNFVHTAEVNVSGSIPSDDKEKIKEIFNNGVTIWHTNDIGNYDLDNVEV
jgi:hypothetical protein